MEIEESICEDDIDIFNANFVCKDEESILKAYKTDKKIENNDIISKKVIKEKYSHPLFLNYNYCLFCLERRNTKYDQQNLIDIHNIVSVSTICDYLKKEKIKLKKPKNKNEKLAKRRFIHSSEHIKQKMNQNKFSDSDTELYIEKENKIHLNKKNSRNIKKKKTEDIKSNRNDTSSNLNLISRFDYQDTKLTIKTVDTQSNKSEKIKILKSYDIISIKNSLFQNDNYNNDKNRSLIFSNKSSIKRSVRSLSKDKNSSLLGIITDYFNDLKNKSKNYSIMTENDDESSIQSFQYLDKNEKCEICHGIIENKFTLFCGDFYCRECIIDLIKQGLTNISLFDKIVCPQCNEPINENTIKFLLDEDYLNKYNKIKIKIEGLKNKYLIPCPYPNCEGFANKQRTTNNMLKCQNNHIFCKKCLGIILPENVNNAHICPKKLSETIKYLRDDKNIRKCPQCHTWVEREPGGCNHFICTNIWCKFEFCWICGNKYDPYHYRNPFSMCFNLGETHSQEKIIKSENIRRTRCILISLASTLILFPIIAVLFSFFEIGCFIFYFQLDGKEFRNIRFHSKIAYKLFYHFYIFFFVAISIALISFGYLTFIFWLLFIPIIILQRKRLRDKENNFNAL